MRNYREDESRCSRVFTNLGKCHHLWTSEKCELIFQSDDDFRSGMNVIGICAKLFPQIRILTFEIMSNHLHVAMAGSKESSLAFFDAVKKFLMRHLKKQGRIIDWSGFNASIRELSTLDDVRNVIVYNNRNGYVVSDYHTPFTYPWGANRYYFNPDSVELAALLSRPVNQRERQASINSRIADNVEGLTMYKGCISPPLFLRHHVRGKPVPRSFTLFQQARKRLQSPERSTRSDPCPKLTRRINWNQLGQCDMSTMPRSDRLQDF